MFVSLDMVRTSSIEALQYLMLIGFVSIDSLLGFKPSCI